MIPQKRILVGLDQLPTLDEVKKAVGQINSGQAAGMDGNPAELFKSAGLGTFRSSHDILISIWEEETMP